MRQKAEHGNIFLYTRLFCRVFASSMAELRIGAAELGEPEKPDNCKNLNPRKEKRDEHGC